MHDRWKEGEVSMGLRDLRLNELGAAMQMPPCQRIDRGPVGRGYSVLGPWAVLIADSMPQPSR
jgi:hypothetical protein